MTAALKVLYSPARLSTRVASLGRAISQDYKGRTLDVVVLLENAFIFGADLVRRINRPVVCHFVRTELRDVKIGGHDRREIFFSQHPQLKDRNVLLVDTVLHTGVTVDFLMKRLLEGHPRSLRLAVLVDKPHDRRVDLSPDYIGFVGASNKLAGYGLSGMRGWYRNLPYIGFVPEARRRSAARARSRGKSGPGVRRER